MTPEQLKVSILQYAVRGKLTKQSSTDSFVENLLDSIKAERIKLVNEKRSSLPKGMKEIGNEEFPYDIPDNWQWVRLGEIASVIRGLTFKTSYKEKKESTILVLRGGNIDSSTEKLIYDDNIFVDDSIPNKNQYLQRGDCLIVASSGTKSSVGKSVHIDDILPDVSFGGFMMVVRPSALIESKLIAYHIKLYRQKIINDTAGYISNITNPILNNLLIPLPPLEEQHRIVAKIEELLPLVDQYAASYEKLEQINAKFPGDMKKSILQYAIQGKLVEQRPEEGNAEELFQNIKEKQTELIKNNKIKKAKRLEPINENDVPFELPRTWKWVKWGDIVNIVSARRVHQSDWKKEGIPFYRAREIAEMSRTGGYVNNELFISEELYNDFSASGVPKSGDIMVTAVGTLGKTYIVKDTDKFYYKDASVICFENHYNLCSEYLAMVMQTPFMNRQIKNNSEGTTVATLTMVRMVDYLFPLPPLGEQHRIVAKIKELLPYCDMLQKK